MRTIETGLRDDNILMKLRPILQNTLISDEELIHQVSSISSAETERQARLGKTAKGFQAIAVVATDERENKPASQKSSHEKTTSSHILATVQAMQDQIRTIQGHVLFAGPQDPRTPDPRTPDPGPQDPGPQDPRSKCK